jgi:hypothetical protein
MYRISLRFFPNRGFSSSTAAGNLLFLDSGFRWNDANSQLEIILENRYNLYCIMSEADVKERRAVWAKALEPAYWIGATDSGGKCPAVCLVRVIIPPS